MSFRVTVFLTIVSVCFLGVFCGCAPKVAERTDEGELYLYLDPANIYEDTMEIHYELPYESEVQPGFEGLIISDVQIIYHGRNLPEEVSLNEIQVGSLIDIDDNGALPEGYEYYFVTYTATNAYREQEKDYYPNGTSIFVVADDYRIVTPSSDACYLNGWDFTEFSTTFGLEELKVGETKTFTVGYILKQDDIKKGSLYFIPDYSLGQHVDATVLTFLAMKLS